MTPAVTALRSPIAEAVLCGLTAPEKSLPAWLLYDATGSAIYERITTLPEYYPFRTEQAILTRHAPEMLAHLGPLSELVELGAGSAAKTRIVLRAARGGFAYVPIDVSPSALDTAHARIKAEFPWIPVRPRVGHHTQVLGALPPSPRRLVLFIGSSIGNFEDDEAARILQAVRRVVDGHGGLLLGTDLQKSPARLLPAYDDAAGVTAAFNRNVLVRINRELGGRFDPDTFRHVAVWNAAASRVEMHLESDRAQTVPIDALEMSVALRRNERIHTESSVKYTLTRVDTLLAAAGFARAHTWTDDERLFAVHLARPV